MTRWMSILLVVVSAFLCLRCSDEDPAGSNIAVIGITANDLPLTNNAENIPLDAIFRINFSKRINTATVKEAITIDSGGSDLRLSFEFFAGGTGVVIQHEGLIANVVYTLSIRSTTPIGQNGEALNTDYTVQFRSQDNGIIKETTPCQSAVSSCLYSMFIDNGNSSYIRLYSSYPLFDEKYRLDNIRNLIIVIHGQNRNADDYFNDMSSNLKSWGLANNTLLVAPWINEPQTSQTGELFWSGNEWRQGEVSGNNNQRYSSFKVIETLWNKLLESNEYPSIENILIAGHSSGATFTYMLSGAIDRSQFIGKQFHFAVLNSQYFYYPQDLRWNDARQQFETPLNCSDYDEWPYGYRSSVSYVQALSREDFNLRLVQSHLTYLLGTNDVVTTGTLNTNDCAAVLLGEHRLDRGNKIYDFITNTYAEAQHQRVLVPDVGHNFSQMFGAAPFREYLLTTLE